MSIEKNFAFYQIWRFSGAHLMLTSSWLTAHACEHGNEDFSSPTLEVENVVSCFLEKHSNQKISYKLFQKATVWKMLHLKPGKTSLLS